MAYPFVQGISYGARNGPVQAFVIHMAEGGNTVNYLRADATPPDRGVSVHYVIEYSGRIVQMLRENEASGSINPNALRQSEGPYPYGASVRMATMGVWDSNPNEAVISVEIEGFASQGPNADQRRALGILVNDVRSRFPHMGLLGHRDFTSTKACPGPHIPWDILGGHGLGSEVDVVPVDYYGPWTVDIAPGVQLYDLSGAPLVKVSTEQRDKPAPSETDIGTRRLLMVMVQTGGKNQYVFVDPAHVTDRRKVAADCSAQEATITEAIRVLQGG